MKKMKFTCNLHVIDIKYLLKIIFKNIKFVKKIIIKKFQIIINQIK